MAVIQTLCSYAKKDVRIRGRFSRQKGVREQNRLGNNSVVYLFFANQSECPRVGNHVVSNILVFKVRGWQIVLQNYS